MQANRNGFFYVLERSTGKLLAANPFVKVNWAEHVDLPPAVRCGRRRPRMRSKGKTVQVWPSLVGGKNWHPMSFNPETKLIYVNTMDFGWEYTPLPLDQVTNLKAGQPHYGVKRPWPYFFDDPNGRGYLRAVDPLTGKSKWAVPFKSPNIAGTLVTAGGLVFTGRLTGEVMAVDSDTGKILWEFQTSAGIVGQPVTWEKDGKQYVTVTNGGDRTVRDARRRSQPRQRPGRRQHLDVQGVRGVRRTAARGPGQLGNSRLALPAAVIAGERMGRDNLENP